MFLSRDLVEVGGYLDADDPREWILRGLVDDPALA